MIFFASLLFISLFKLDNIQSVKLVRHTGLMYAKAMGVYWFLVGRIRKSRYLISENRRLSKPLKVFTQVIIWICLNKNLTFEYLF